MVLGEPKAEFVPLDFGIVTAASICNNDETSKRGSVETCTGPDAPYNTDDCCQEDTNPSYMF